MFRVELALGHAVAAGLMSRAGAAVLPVLAIASHRVFSATGLTVFTAARFSIFLRALFAIFARAAIHGRLAILAVFLAAVHVLAFAAILGLCGVAALVLLIAAASTLGLPGSLPRI